MTHRAPMPGSPAPALDVPALGGTVGLGGGGKLSLVFFYRGVHCPICKTQMEELAGRRGELAEMGIETVAVSMDSEERARRQREEWDLGDMPIGYGLSEASAREWGLYISTKAKDAEPDIFAEPGIVAVNPDGSLYALWLQTVPFARPTLDGLKKGLSFVLDNDYPVRGTRAA